MLGKEKKRLKKVEQCQNCLVIMDLRRGIKENSYPLITNCRIATYAWKRLQEVYGNSCELVCDNIQDYMSKKLEPYSL